MPVNRVHESENGSPRKPPTFGKLIANVDEWDRAQWWTAMGRERAERRWTAAGLALLVAVSAVVVWVKIDAQTSAVQRLASTMEAGGHPNVDADGKSHGLDQGAAPELHGPR